MNIFYTDASPTICALEHCSIHRNKMIIEYAQLLSTAHHVLDGDKAIEGIYKPTHVNHPCAKWVRESKGNYAWLLRALSNLLVDYAGIAATNHKTTMVYRQLCCLPINIPKEPFSPPPFCGPDKYKHLEVREAYKAYLNDKFKEWLSRNPPLVPRWEYGKPVWVI